MHTNIWSGLLGMGMAVWMGVSSITDPGTIPGLKGELDSRPVRGRETKRG